MRHVIHQGGIIDIISQGLSCPKVEGQADFIARDHVEIEFDFGLIIYCETSRHGIIWNGRDDIVEVGDASSQS